MIKITIPFYSFLGNSKITPGTAPRAIRVCSLVEVYSAADEITSIAGETAESDLKGNLTEFEINAKEYEVEYDLDNRMSKVEIDGDEVEYRYDAMGRRILRKEDNTTTALIWWNNSVCCLLYTSPSPRDQRGSRMPSSA